MSESSSSAASDRIELTVPANASGRVDRFLGEALADSGLSRSVLQELIKTGAVLVNGARVKTRYAVVPGDKVVVSIPEPTSDIPAAETIPLTVLFEDDDLIVVNKSHGMVRALSFCSSGADKNGCCSCQRGAGQNPLCRRAGGQSSRFYTRTHIGYTGGGDNSSHGFV